MNYFSQNRKVTRTWASLALAAVLTTSTCQAINITLDFTLDEQNENWFNPSSPLGQARRASVAAAADFFSTIITNDDWSSLPALNESITFSDIAASTIFDLDGNLLTGTPERDGDGFAYASSSNNVDITNRSSVAANEYVVYVGAFPFASNSNARGGWDSFDRRNAAGVAETEFNTWGGRIYFNTSKPWYVGSNPGVDPTDNYGFQDPNKQPTTDITSDNWDWSTSSDSWKGFDLRSIDPAAGNRDLYATALHELMHALGATSSVMQQYLGEDTQGNFLGTNVMQVYGGPVPGDGGHFAANVQSLVWNSADIVSEALLDPNSLSGVRKYLTQLDAALLKDLGYQVLDTFPTTQLVGDFNQDGTVNAADYTLWRDTLSSTTNLAADANQDGIINTADYALWKANYGNSQAATATLAQIPEPATLLLLLSVWASLTLRKR